MLWTNFWSFWNLVRTNRVAIRDFLLLWLVCCDLFPNGCSDDRGTCDSIWFDNAPLSNANGHFTAGTRLAQHFRFKKSKLKTKFGKGMQILTWISRLLRIKYISFFVNFPGGSYFTVWNKNFMLVSAGTDFSWQKFRTHTFTVDSNLHRVKRVYNCWIKQLTKCRSQLMKLKLQLVHTTS